jgi:complement component 1 Q subcomponent-binding protein|eukprot:gene8615-6206_t
MLARAIVKNVAKRTMRLGAKAVAQPLASYSSAVVAMKEVESPYTRVAAMARREIDFEVTGTEVDVEHEDAKKIVEKHFTVSEEKGKGEVILTRTHNDEKIQVFFHVQDVEDENMFDEEEDVEETEEENGGSIGVNFRVEITRGDKKMIIAALGGQELDVRAVRFVPANVDRNSEEIYYGGPEFSELEEDFQEAFLDFLEERKIDGDLAFFVLSHSREKEQKEYVNWLETLETFSAK